MDPERRVLSGEDIAVSDTPLAAHRSLLTEEFPWTAEAVYLNAASIGPLPARTRRAVEEYAEPRSAPLSPPPTRSSTR